jgi:hypothetical protein
MLNAGCVPYTPHLDWIQRHKPPFIRFKAKKSNFYNTLKLFLRIAVYTRRTHAKSTQRLLLFWLQGFKAEGVDLTWSGNVGLKGEM